MQRDFLLVVVTPPAVFAGEAVLLQQLLDAGVERLHIRKPGAAVEKVADLLEELPAAAMDRVVLHGFRKLALHYGISQVHGPWRESHGDGLAVSSSLHSWKEVKEIPAGRVEYVLISPLFDSISKTGYAGHSELLACPAGPRPCRCIGLGGISEGNIRQVMAAGWDGAAVLGWIWEDPAAAVDRYHTLKEIIDHGVYS